VFRRITDAISTVGVGGLVGAIVCFAIDERPAGALVIATAALGAVIAHAIRQAIHGRTS
jgi:multisubunit Na+/H+ antiporter MnhG subunit